MICEQTFSQLKQREKIKLLFEEGSFVVSIRYYGYKINLYLLFNYYVEVFYNHKLDLIEKIEIFDNNPSRTKFYSDQIKLPGNII